MPLIAPGVTQVALSRTNNVFLVAADPGARAGSVARIPADVTAVGFARGEALTGQDAGAFHAFRARRR